MGAHHDHQTAGLDRKVIWIVLILNLGMFLIEIFQGIDARSTSLIADSIDFLSDSFNYAITLYVMHKSLQMRAKAALIKAGCMLLLGAVVLMQGVYNIIQQATPEYETMGWIGLLALIINLFCTILLFRTRGKDSNMQSVWLCSRNDTIGNLLIIIAAGLVFATGSLWPDFIVALVIAGLASHSALQIIAQAKKELKQ